MNNNKITERAFLVYSGYFYKAELLNTLAQKGPQKKEEFLRETLLFTQKDDKICWGTDMRHPAEALGELIKMGLIEISEGKAILTTKGLEVVQNGTWNGLSATSFSSYNSLVIASKALLTARISLFVSLCVLAVSLIVQLFLR